jgi:hypothetical protein
MDSFAPHKQPLIDVTFSKRCKTNSCRF